jgi:sialate O-acetylesterase
VGGGLASRDGQKLNWFEIIDAEEGGFVKADAQIDGSAIVLSAPEVKHPVAMHFAWSMLAEPNLMNAEGLPANSFRAGTVPKRDLLVVKVPEAKDYKLVYDLDLAKLGPTITYDVNNRAKIQQPFDRIAYFLELQGADGNTQYLYVSMDAFTDALDKIGVPTVSSGAHFQQNVANMNVYSNAKGIVARTGLAGGNIEFWPNNYGPANSANVPNASAQVWDFGDEPAEPVDGYGSMQIHNHDARQTLFALNHWREGSHADLGIGNQPTDNPDWTFAGNAGSYQAKRLRVLVRCK